MSGFIYVAECSGLYKIGYARDSPRTRIQSLQVGNPLEVTLIGVVEGSREIEAEWHWAFREKRVRGEWFRLTEEDVARILHDPFGIDYLLRAGIFFLENYPESPNPVTRAWMTVSLSTFGPVLVYGE